MAKVNYKDVWRTLKEEMTQEYIELINGADDIAKVESCVLREYLERCDYLDGTNEFSNLKSDMKLEDMNK